MVGRLSACQTRKQPARRAKANIPIRRQLSDGGPRGGPRGDQQSPNTVELSGSSYVVSLPCRCHCLSGAFLFWFTLWQPHWQIKLNFTLMGSQKLSCNSYAGLSRKKINILLSASQFRTGRTLLQPNANYFAQPCTWSPARSVVVVR